MIYVISNILNIYLFTCIILLTSYLYTNVKLKIYFCFVYLEKCILEEFIKCIEPNPKQVKN